MNKTMKFIQLPQWGRVGLSLTIQFISVFFLLGTVNGFAGNYASDPQTSFGVQQQKKRVSGTVTDANGEAVIDANVMEKGTKNGTVTDTDGRFSLAIESEGVLQISYIGYLGQEINTAGRTSFDIVLREDTRALEEVVVVGYGTQKKVNLTGALASVGHEEIKSISTANLVTELAGKLPGLKVTQRTGEPGSYTTSYDIRGFGAPLIVVDGIVRDGSDFARLDPHDIESITILKDASATVYGIKAANGVILVTTKKGETGKPTISYTGAYEWQRRRIPAWTSTTVPCQSLKGTMIDVQAGIYDLGQKYEAGDYSAMYNVETHQPDNKNGTLHIVGLNGFSGNEKTQTGF